VDPAPPTPPPAAPTPPAAPPRSGAAAFLGAVVLLGLLGSVAQAGSPVLGLVWTEVFAFLSPALVVVAGRNLLPSRYLRLRPARPAAVLLGAVAGLAGYPAAAGIMALASLLLPAAWVASFDVSRLLELPGAQKYAFAAVAATLAPLCEEAAFRGYVQTTLAVRVRPAAAIAGSALLFAAIHVDPVRFPALLVLGALFAWLAWRAGSLWPAVAAHAANNAAASALFLALGAGGGAERPDAGAAARAVAVGIALVAPVLLAYRAVTPSPPPPGEAIAVRDPARPAGAFALASLPPRYAALWVAGTATLALLLLAAALRRA
jgi:membrane protease YdiL (CAAX protease family)